MVFKLQILLYGDSIYKINMYDYWTDTYIFDHKIIIFKLKKIIK
jgi:hypothetical protein